jgi:hypothetical protein
MPFNNIWLVGIPDIVNFLDPVVGYHICFLLKSLCPPISEHLERELGCPNSLDCTLKGIVHGEGHLFPTRNRSSVFSPFTRPHITQAFEAQELAGIEGKERTLGLSYKL